MSIRSADDIKTARKIAIAWAIPGITGAFFIDINWLDVRDVA